MTGINNDLVTAQKNKNNIIHIDLDPKQNIKNKKYFKTLLNKIAETSLENLDEQLANFYHDEAELNAFHPINEIKGIDEIKNLKDIYIYHAGTKKVNNLIFTNGGRVLNVTSLGENVKEANYNALTAINMINWNGSYHRNDIGWRAIKREENG